MKKKLLIIFLSTFILLIFSCSKSSASKSISAQTEDIYALTENNNTSAKIINASAEIINASAENITSRAENMNASVADINTPTTNINAPLANINAPGTNIYASNSGNTASKKIDIDLTKASKTIIYATVFNMVVEPDDFIGKTVRVSGNFRVFEDDYSDDRYYAIIIPDATACCETGIEFIWEGEHNYPEDYPAVEQKITITGKYNVMEFEDGVSYFYLDVSDIEF